MLLGAGIALLTSLSWALSSIIIKPLTSRIPTLFINTFRMWLGSTLLLSFILISGKYTAIPDIPLPSLIYVIVSGVLAMAIGDTSYIKSLSMLDASIAFPIAQCAFVLLAGLAAILWLNEPYTWITVAGAILVMLGIYLVASEGNGKAGTLHNKTVNVKGVFVALFAAVIWASSTITLKIGAQGIDPFVVAAIRISCSAVVLTGLSAIRGNKAVFQLKQYGAKSLLLICVAGMLTYGVAAVGYVSAIQMIGAAKTVLLTTSAPLFALFFSILFLKERPTRSTIVGIIASVGGVILVVV